MFSEGILRYQRFYLDRTLILSNLPKNFIIAECEFIALPGFIGDSLILIKDSDQLTITSCYLDCRNMPMKGIEFEPTGYVYENEPPRPYLGSV